MRGLPGYILWVTGALALALAACAPGPLTAHLTAGEAVDLVLAQDERFAGIGPRDPQLIGQAAWHEVSEDDGGWQVVIRMGWGDCPAGCISEHRWTYVVSGSGEVELASEIGDPLPADPGIRGTVTAGPACPVVTDPPDPACADRPVPGAVLVVTTLTGVEVARAVTDAEGRFALALAPGTYRLAAQPVEGLMGTPEAVEFGLDVGTSPLELMVSYDTGIR